MGFLHKLWDETLAGPAPETGLGKLRKYDSLSSPASPTMSATRCPSLGALQFLGPLLPLLETYHRIPAPLGAPQLPPGTPSSPGTPGAMNFKKLTRRKSSADALERAEPRSPNWLRLDGNCCFGSLREEVMKIFLKYPPATPHHCT